MGSTPIILTILLFYDMKEKGFKRNKAIMLAFSLGYRAKENGDIISPKGNIVGNLQRNGYKKFTIRYKGQIFNIPTHRFVAYQKYGEIIFSCECVRHLDGDCLNNSFNNIEIGTLKDNSLDIPKLKRIESARYAASCYSGYNNDERVKKIKEFHAKTKSYKKTMEHFGISSKGTLHFILNNR